MKIKRNLIKNYVGYALLLNKRLSITKLDVCSSGSSMFSFGPV